MGATEHRARDAYINIALLIDAANSPVARIEIIFAELAELGLANIRRAYGKPWLCSFMAQTGP